MEEKGYLLFVLNTHLPYIRSPDIEYPQEESWLFEAITGSYIPLIQVIQGLIEYGADFKMTFSFTPCLMAMLTDPLLQKRYIRYLDDRIHISENEVLRLKNHPPLQSLARHYNEKFRKIRKLFSEVWEQDIIARFKKLKDSGKVDIIASGATHAYFPLWEMYPKIIDFQIQIGIRQYKKYIDPTGPTGFWLPECGYFTNLDAHLQGVGIKYFFLDRHGILNGHPRPKYGEYAPVLCPSGLAAFGRDWVSHDLIWLKDKGYPGDSLYLNYDRDVCFDVEKDYLTALLHHNHIAKTGIKYFRNRPIDGCEIYDPGLAFSRCDEHANDFISRCQNQVEYLYNRLGRKPVIVALFDTEHFGHWWAEGPTWLDLVIRKLVYDQKSIKLITAKEYLKIYPTNQVVMPSMSSWGYQGYSETWLMGRNHWIYPELYRAIDTFEERIEKSPIEGDMMKEALNQYLRELLLAQTSDWAFIMHVQTVWEYAEKMVKTHIKNMTSILEQLNHNHIDVQWLHWLKNKDNIFPDLDLLSIYRGIKLHRA